ncbi:hypothetical protein GTQ40_08380 [Flavobacteriaceae bacterium R38]|nr:hypothetical protein [Flavobacteriaceae bacterium R38]
MKTIRFKQNINSLSKPIRIYSNPTTVSLKINKKWCMLQLRRIGFILAIFSYLSLVWASYATSKVHFQYLVETGIILGLVALYSSAKNLKSNS